MKDQRGIQTKAAQVHSPLRYPDTMSARDGVNELARKLLGIKVGIVGVGGSGAYILDALSKTHLELIRIFDDDIMGLYRTPDGLDGMLRVSGGDVADAAKLIGTEYLPGANPADNEYRRQPQIGELNALNAALAVIRFKQRMGVFERHFDASASVFEIGTFDLDHFGGPA